MSKIQLRRGTAAQWTSADPTLAAGEVGFETDTNKFKIGDGSTAWVSLAYFAGTGLANIVEDTTPQLGGDLDVNGNAITGYLPSIDEDDMVSDSAAYVPTQQSVKAYVDAAGSGISNIVEDTTPQLGGDLDVNGNAITGYLPSIDEDDMVSDSAAYVPTQQSVKAYADSVAGDVLPVADTTALVKGSADATKLVRFEVDGLTTGTTRVITVPDEDFTLNTIKSDTTGEPSGSDVVSNVVSLTQAEYDAGSPVAGTFYVITDAVETVVFNMACSDETSDLAVGTSVYTFRMPFAMTLTGVKASVNTAPTGSAITVGINESAVSVLSTDITIDATEKTSTTATTPAVISDSALADDAEITIDIDQVGSTITGAGLKVTLYGTTV